MEGGMDGKAVGFWSTGVLSKPVPVVAGRSGVLEWSVGITYEDNHERVDYISMPFSCS